MIPQDDIAKAFNLIRSTGLLTEKESEELSYKLQLTCPINIHILPVSGTPEDFIMVIQPNDFLRCEGCDTIFPKTEGHACVGGKKIF